MPLISFAAGQVMRSADVNSNFGLCVLTDTSRAITVTHTYSATQTFTGGWTAGAVCTISTGGLTITAGGLSVTGTHTQIGDLLFTDATYDIGKSGATRPRDGFFSRNASVGGTLSVTGQTTLGAALNMNADVLMNGVVYGTNDANGLRFGINGVGTFWKVTTAGALIATQDGIADIGASGATRPRSIFLTGSITFSAAAGKIIPGATSISLRNNADSADNVLIADSGLVTFRNNITFAASPQIQMPAAGNVDFRLASNAGSALLINDTGTVQVSNGVLVTRASVTGGPGLRLIHGVAPTAPTDGDMWTTTAGAFIRINGVTKTFTLT